MYFEKNLCENTSTKKFYCDASDIKQLNETKRYTLIASDILNKVLTDDRLISPAAKLWHFLYSKATLNSDMQVSIAYSQLAKSFDKSTRTIIRYIASLKQFGYIEVVNNYTNHGQTINTLYIKLPFAFIKDLKSNKDRAKKIKVVKDTKTNVQSTYIEDTNNCETNQSFNSDTVKEHENTALDSSKINEETIQANIINEIIEDNLNNESTLDTLYNSFDSSKFSISELYDSIRYHSALESTKEILKNNSKCFSSDNYVIAGNDKVVTHINTSNRYLLNNSSQLTNIPMSLRNINSKQNSQFVIFNNQVKRKIPEIQKDRISEKLELLGYYGNANTTITDQIIFSVEKESLSSKPINHAINIALKLVKTKRWTTPCGLRKQIN